jgi:hypothetical protein
MNPIDRICYHSAVQPENFRRIDSAERAQANAQWTFEMQLPKPGQVVRRLWQGLEKEIQPATCSIYSYDSTRPGAFTEGGAVFHLCYSFLNEKTQKVAITHLQQGGTNVPSDDENDSSDKQPHYGSAFF